MQNERHVFSEIILGLILLKKVNLILVTFQIIFFDKQKIMHISVFIFGFDPPFMFWRLLNWQTNFELLWAGWIL